MRRAVEELLERGEDMASLAMSEIEARALPDDELEELYERLDARGIEIRDDVGRGEAAATTYENGDLATATLDALQLFLNEIGRYPLLTAREEVELAKRIERGDREAKNRMINWASSCPPTRRSPRRRSRSA